MNGIHAIVLAAGAGSRFGGGKMLAPWAGRPLVWAAVKSALAAPVDEVVVVVGDDADRIAAALAPLESPRLRLVRAADWRDGLSASLRAGIVSLPADSRGVLVFLGDMPLIPRDLPALIVGALEAGAPAAQPLVDGAPGHPAGFSRRLYDALVALKGDAGAASLLRNRADVVHVPVADRGANFDVDRPDDTEAASRIASC